MAYEAIADRAPLHRGRVDDSLGSPHLVEQLDEALPRAGVSVAGLKTTVFPATSASSRRGSRSGSSTGDDADDPIGMRTDIWNLSRARRESSARTGAAFSAHVVAHVDLPGRRRRPRLTFPISCVIRSVSSALCSPRSCANRKKLAALGSRHEPPLLVGLLRRRDGVVDVVGVGLRERADVLAVGGARDRRYRPRRRPPTRRR